MFVFAIAFSQELDIEMQKRKDALNTFSKRKKPLILINEKNVVSLDEYLSYHDKFVDYNFIKTLVSRF